MTRTEHGDENDTRKTIQRLAQLRAQKAKLLGYVTFAAYQLADQMAKTPENALKLLTDTVTAATAKAKGRIVRTEERCGGKEGVSTGRTRWSRANSKKNKKIA